MALSLICHRFTETQDHPVGVVGGDHDTNLWPPIALRRVYICLTVQNLCINVVPKRAGLAALQPSVQNIEALLTRQIFYIYLQFWG